MIFTGILSRVVFAIKFPSYRWIALGLVFAGVMIVGVSPIAFPTPADTTQCTTTASESAITGGALVLSAQFFTATQFVVEEKILMRYRSLHPLHLIGLEGLYGVLMWSAGMVVLAFTVSNGGTLDVALGFRQITSSPLLIGTSIGVMLCMGPL